MDLSCVDVRQYFVDVVTVACNVEIHKHKHKKKILNMPIGSIHVHTYILTCGNTHTHTHTQAKSEASQAALVHSESDVGGLAEIAEVLQDVGPIGGKILGDALRTASAPATGA